MIEETGKLKATGCDKRYFILPNPAGASNGFMSEADIRLIRAQYPSAVEVSRDDFMKLLNEPFDYKNAPIRDTERIDHDNGFSALLYGERSMWIYKGDLLVYYTEHRTVNTENDVKEYLSRLPEQYGEDKIQEIREYLGDRNGKRYTESLRTTKSNKK